MKEITAKNTRQLDMLLRVLFAEKIGIQFKIRAVKTDANKFSYLVEVETDDAKIKELEERLRILTA